MKQITERDIDAAIFIIGKIYRGLLWIENTILISYSLSKKRCLIFAKKKQGT